jgi:hypothetical protein
MWGPFLGDGVALCELPDGKPAIEKPEYSTKGWKALKNIPAQGGHLHRILTKFRRTVPMAIPNLQCIQFTAVNL